MVGLLIGELYVNVGMRLAMLTLLLMMNLY